MTDDRHVIVHSHDGPCLTSVSDKDAARVFRYASVDSDRTLTLVESEGIREGITEVISPPDVLGSGPEQPFEECQQAHPASYRQMASPPVGLPTCDSVHGAYALFIWQDCDPASEQDLHDWYAREHIPLLMEVPGWLRVRRFTRTAGPWPKFLTIHELDALTVFSHEKYTHAVSTPWRNRIAQQRQNRVRLVARRLPDTASARTG